MAAAPPPRPTPATTKLAPTPALAPAPATPTAIPILHPASIAGSGSASACTPTPASSSTKAIAPQRLLTTAHGMPSTASPSVASSASSPDTAAATPTVSMTTKEWVIPPRPKPGRKPATDTPPTKRKAQNRAAQRAFRERRAARVGELEDQIIEHREDRDKVEAGLRDRIRALELELQSFKSQCMVLERLLERERRERLRVETEAGPLRRIQASFSDYNNNHNNNNINHSNNSINISHNNSMSTTTPHQQPAPPLVAPQMLAPSPEPNNLGCGSCQPSGPCACADALADAMAACGRCADAGSRCECLEESMQAVIPTQDLKRPPPPSTPPLQPHGEKRHRAADGSASMETDLTAMFARKHDHMHQSAQSDLTEAQAAASSLTSLTSLPSLPPPSQVLPADRCGLCEDGSYCACAYANLKSGYEPDPPLYSSAAPATMESANQMRTPPRCDTDPLEITATGAVKIPWPRRNPAAAAAAAKTTKTTCGPGGPGTCAQCVADPRSGLFCRSLAARLEGGGGCCGSGGGGRRGPNGECCKSVPRPPPATTPAAAPAPAPAPGPALAPTPSPATATAPGDAVLSCADAYRRLRDHRHFGEAVEHMGSWLPRLRAAPAAPPLGRMILPTAERERPPIEVETASIMSVLKDFDVRFGRDK